MLAPVKAFIRYSYYRSALFRRVMGWLSVTSGRTGPLGVEHLATYREEDSIGPLQREEALLLFALTRVLRPRVIVEFGFFQGHSAFNFLRALDPGSRIFSYDLADDAKARFEKELNFDPRLSFFHKSQTDFAAADIGHQLIDLVFFDGAHELTANCATFQKIHPCLRDNATVVIHDTGLWNRDRMLPLHQEFIKLFPGEWVSDSQFAHQPDERQFVDWICQTYPEMQAIHLHSSNTLRHGMTWLQRRQRLSQSPSQP